MHSQICGVWWYGAGGTWLSSPKQFVQVIPGIVPMFGVWVVQCVRRCQDDTIRSVGMRPTRVRLKDEYNNIKHRLTTRARRLVRPGVLRRVRITSGVSGCSTRIGRQLQSPPRGPNAILRNRAHGPITRNRQASPCPVVPEAIGTKTNPIQPETMAKTMDGPDLPRTTGCSSRWAGLPHEGAKS